MWYIVDSRTKLLNYVVISSMETKYIRELIRDAGNIAMKHYKGDINIDTKSDNSPVTNADIEVNSFILKGLAKISPDIPVVAEENHPEDNHKHITAKRFWCVDPIDGTKGYINHTDEFTVNIGLVLNNKTVQGFIYSPCSDELYFNEGRNAYKEMSKSKSQLIKCRSIPDSGARLLMSTRYTDEALHLFKDIEIEESLPIGSAVKFCIIAEGLADGYPRIGPTCEWDTAAGQAIVEAAGGIVNTIDGQALSYGKKSFLNPNFVVRGLL